VIRLTIKHIREEEICDKCPFPGARHMALFRLEERTTTGTNVLNVCSKCFEEEVGSWDQRGQFAHDALPEVNRPPMAAPGAYYSWPLPYRTPALGP
jgi:hypothetical protein